MRRCYEGRLVQLVPTAATATATTLGRGADDERRALKLLFAHRFSPDPVQARAEWLDVVEARHRLWAFISSPKRELIRSVLNTVNMEVVKRARPTSVFNFAEASIGNLFLTGYVTLHRTRALRLTLGGQSASLLGLVRVGYLPLLHHLFHP